jgi:hypothetical protein
VGERREAMKRVVMGVGAVAAAAGVLGLAGAAGAAVTYMAQTRTVSATSSSGTSADMAPDFLMWVGNVANANRITGTSAAATQESDLLPDMAVRTARSRRRTGRVPTGRAVRRCTT